MAEEKKEEKEAKEESRVEEAKAPKPEAKELKTNDNKPKTAGAGKLAVIRVRGPISSGNEKNNLMKSLRIFKKNSCAVHNDTPSIRGMLKKISDLVTWGEVDAATVKLLAEKRGKENSKTFFLSPPKGGFERKGTKVPYSIGGALGYRGKEISKIIQRMV